MPFSPGDLGSLLAFMACVGVAATAQNLTGFAFGLVLLGMTSMLHVASVADAANASMALTLVNAWTYFRHHPEPPPWRLMRPVLAGSVVGVLAGVALLGWLSASAVDLLRALLGVCILGCAALLLLQGRALAGLSGAGSFATVGTLSGLLGGLFSASGPPIVYQMYRQPLDRETVKRSLLLVFAFNALVRLVVVLPSGLYSLHALLLTVCAMPVVYGVTRWHQRHPPELSPRLLQRIVAGLLFASGATLLATALGRMA